MPIGAFSPLGLIKSADHNSNYGDIATALTQSLATTGVATMTGPIKAADGSVAAPSYSFGTGLTTGFFLAGANQIGWSAAGVLGATFNSDLSVTWNGAHTFSGNVTYGAITWTVSASTITFNATARAQLHSTLNNNISIQLIIDGGGNTITTGTKGFIEVPAACTVGRWTIVADQSGSAVVDIWRANAAVPNVANTIAGSALPTLSSAQFNTTTTLTGWNTTLAARDIIGFNVNSATTVQRVTVALTALRT